MKISKGATIKIFQNFWQSLWAVVKGDCYQWLDLFRISPATLSHTKKKKFPKY